jgi:cation:H+ antiporter
MPQLTEVQLLILCAGAIGFGFYLLARGGDWLIDACVFIASRQGLSKLLIGATIVAFGTSAPEMAVSLDAALKGFHDLSLGNVVGSNSANILFILGLQILIVGVVAASPKALRRDVLAMVIASGALLAFALMGLLPRWGGVVMVSALVLFTIGQIQREKRLARTNPERAAHEHAKEQDDISTAFRNQWHAMGFVLIGLATLVLGARVLVTGAVIGAQTFGISEAVIGLTIVAVGTSLPELFAGLIAARKGHGELAIGNIVGSNLFNILAILGVTAVAVPLTITPEMLTNIVLMVGITVAFSAWLLITGRMTRPLGALMVAAYVAYTIWLYQGVAA